MTSADREELVRLRRENKQLRLERDMLMMTGRSGFNRPRGISWPLFGTGGPTLSSSAAVRWSWT